MTTRVLVLVGTKKGAFILESDERREDWRLRGPFCENWPIYHMTYDAATNAIYAGGGNSWFGPAVWRSTDLGETWSQSGAGITYGDEGPAIQKVWHVEGDHGTLYAGVDPAGLFRSADGGVTWEHVAGLREHPTCSEWQPGFGGLCLHSIIVHPSDPKRLWVAISAVGTFYSDDGGETWQTRNKGVRAEFAPVRYPEFGQCVHKLLLAPDATRLYQQNHCGVYRSDDGGQQWQEISEGLPSDFGFPMAIHPRDSNTIYVIPLEGNGRLVPEGRMAVWRSRDGGDSWAQMTAGLPSENAYLGVLREAMAVDALDKAGIYFGTSTGQVFGSNDEGDTWAQLSDFLPSVWSVETAIVRG
jgi:photosystem II stability/assembly factor-like uncharacterized protein